MNTQNTTAKIAGLLYIVIIVAGMFAEFIVREGLKVPGDTAATINNIVESEGLFRLGIVADLIMIMADVAIGIAFYVLLKPVNHTLALLAAFLRLGQAVTLAVNLFNLIFVTQMISNTAYLDAVGSEQLNNQAMMYFDAHATGYAIGLIFFGFSILTLAYIMIRSAVFPRLLGYMLLAASVAYLVDSFAQVMLTNYADYEPVLANTVLPIAFIAELALAMWLLFKGVKNTSQEDYAPTSGQLPTVFNG